MASILDLYKANQSALGLDKIKTDQASTLAAETPYSLDNGFAADTKVLSNDALKTARGGSLPSTKYTDTKPQ
jgi:hypothetical protein